MPADPDVPAWDRGPRCPDKECGGPLVPIREHHNAKALLQAVLGGHNAACARCDKAVHLAKGADLDALFLAANAWEERAGVKLSRSEFEAQKLKDERAKVARLKEGRW